MNDLIRQIRSRIPGCAVSVSVQESSDGTRSMSNVGVFPLPPGTPEIRDHDGYHASPCWYTSTDSAGEVHLNIARYHDDDVEQALRDILTVLDDLDRRGRDA